MTQNFDFYLKHEQMLDDENEKRKQLADSFQVKMKELSDEATGNKEERQAAFDKN